MRDQWRVTVDFDLPVIVDYNFIKVFLEYSSPLSLVSDFVYRRCHEKTYVSNYAFITLLHEWVDRGQMHQLEKLLCV